MNTTDEHQFAHAVEREVLLSDLPDFSTIATSARQRGGRIRMRRRAGALVTSLAVVAAVGGIGLVAASHPVTGVGAPSFASEPKPAPVIRHVTPAVKPRPQHHRAGSDTSGAYAVLDAGGWTAAPGNNVSDEKLYYFNGDQGVSLNWRPAADYGPKFTSGTVLATTTIDGDPAQVLGDSTGVIGVVGPVKDGRFLTLSGTAGITAMQLAKLATYVHRQ